MDDRELLREYVEHQSEAAFAELVKRHVNLVYATALRVVGDRATAQDVTQTVFIHLARKAWTVRDGNALLGWLYRAAYRTALDTIRSEQRRRQRETEAMNLAEQNTDEATWEKLAPLLDEAMQGLNRAEQNALLLRYFEGKTMRETGEALGTSEAAAQMRVNRALDKMRTHFARGGVTVAAGALATVLATNSAKAAPVELAAQVADSSLAGVGAVGFTELFLKTIFMSTKNKVIMAVIILLVSGLTLTLAFSPRTDVAASGEPASLPAALAKTDLVTKPPVPQVVAPVAAAVKPGAGMSAAKLPESVTTGIVAASADPRTDLKTAIQEIMRLTAAEDYDGMTKEFVSAESVASLPPGVTIESLTQFCRQVYGKPEQRAVLLTAMQAMQDQAPVLDDDGKRATFTTKLPNGAIYSMSLLKENGLWYLDLVNMLTGVPH